MSSGLARWRAVGSRRDVAFWAAVLLSAVVLLVPRAPTPGPDVPGLDKVVHAGIFCLLALTACRRFGRRTAVALALVGYAVGTELAQGLVLPERSAEVLDVGADLAGAAVGWVLARGSTRPRVASQ
ncbi:MAG TPA: VanZ family protein [Mycobacteriales bacterium]|nr:VanZ family protein [Mycobacteriales bacterium]